MSYFAMNVIDRPASPAISFAPFLYTTCRSAISSASAYSRLISCWPGPASPFENSTGTPAASIPLRMARITYSSRVDCKTW